MKITNIVGQTDDQIRSFVMRLTFEAVHQSGLLFSTSKVSCSSNVNKDWLTCSMSASYAMELFQISKFSVYSRPGSSKRYIRTRHPLHINAAASAMIDYIGGAAGKLPVQWSGPTIDHDAMKEEIRGNFRHVGTWLTI